MAWLVVNGDGSEYLFANKPFRNDDPHFGSSWDGGWISSYVSLPKGSIKKLIGRELSWSDEAVEI